MNRQEKENYLIATCDEYGFRKDTKEFREEVSKLSDCVLALKIDSLNDLKMIYMPRMMNIK